MGSTQIFWMELLTSVVVFGIVTVWNVWPYLIKLSRNSALIPLLFVHVPRYVGTTLLVAGMVDSVYECRTFYPLELTNGSAGCPTAFLSR
jgi:hypothetical protein